MTETEWLTRSWGGRPGLIGWLTEVDHKRIAIRYILTAMGFFVAAGVLALLVRLQLARPDNHLLGPATYNAFFTMHGTAMMFLFAVPVMQGMGLYLVPLMIGTRNVAFPRLNLFGYYTFLFGGCFLFASLLMRTAPQAGWFSYVPLASLRFAPDKGTDIWAQTITFTELAALIAAVEIAVTILKLRAPGMSLGRMPIVVWSMLVMSVMVILAMPAIMVASSLLAMDRLVSTRFFTPDAGGDVILWQHLFWFFGHPEVYIVFVPALGFVSQLVVTFTRRSIVGYRTIVGSLIATGAIGFALWAHHMFAAGLSHASGVFFMAASMSIAVPTGLQIFCWLATMWTGRLVLKTPFLFVIGFFLTFVLGGLTGVVLAGGLLVYAAAVLRGARRGPIAGADPWDADTLEWATTSPPPVFNHDPLPCVTSAYPGWGPPAPVVAGSRCDRREILVTSAGAARPSHCTVLDGPAISPLLLGLATTATLVGVVFTPWAIVWGSPLCFAALGVWFWPWTRRR